MLFGGFFNEYPYRDTENLNLDWLLKKYKQILDDVEALKAWRLEHEGEYEALLAEVNRVAGEIDTFEAQINKRFADLDASIHADFEALTTEIRNELAQTQAEIEREFAEALAQFTAQYQALKAEIELELANMKREINALAYELAEAIGSFREEMVTYIDERFDLFIQNLPDYEKLIIYNPIRGYQTTVQVAINDLYSATNFWGLTAREFDSLELTCAEFESYELTCHEFDTLGYKLLGYPDPDTHMRDPFTGLIAPIKDVVMELYGLHMGALTVAEFEALDLTCEEFDAKEVTAFEFDFFGSEAA